MTPAEQPQEKASPQLSRKAAYALAGAAAAGAAAPADAEVIWSGVQNLDIPQFSATDLNLDGDAYNDVLLKNYVFGGGNYQGLYVNFAPGKAVGFFSGFGYASALSAGDAIDAASTAGGPFQASMAYGGNNPNAEFNNADGDFIGLEFPINGTSHFGWVRVTIDNTAGTFVINDWAYESEPGVGIAAGTIPEPGALGLLAAGAAGVAAMRKRREED